MPDGWRPACRIHATARTVVADARAPWHRGDGKIVDIRHAMHGRSATNSREAVNRDARILARRSVFWRHGQPLLGGRLPGLVLGKAGNRRPGVIRPRWSAMLRRRKVADEAVMALAPRPWTGTGSRHRHRRSVSGSQYDRHHGGHLILDCAHHRLIGHPASGSPCRRFEKPRFLHRWYTSTCALSITNMPPPYWASSSSCACNSVPPFSFQPITVPEAQVYRYGPFAAMGYSLCSVLLGEILGEAAWAFENFPSFDSNRGDDHQHVVLIGLYGNDIKQAFHAGQRRERR